MCWRGGYGHEFLPAFKGRRQPGGPSSAQRRAQSASCEVWSASKRLKSDSVRTSLSSKAGLPTKCSSSAQAPGPSSSRTSNGPGGRRNSYGRSASGLRPGGLLHGEDAKSKAAPLEGGEIVLHDRVPLAWHCGACAVERSAGTLPLWLTEHAESGLAPGAACPEASFGCCGRSCRDGRGELTA